MTQNTLPRMVTRPLWIGAIGIIMFFAMSILWAGKAPLVTSIHLSGTLISSQPDYELQHPYGGEIDWVGVRPNQEVTVGQPILRLDFDVERQVLEEKRKQIADLEAENSQLATLLESGFPTHIAYDEMSRSERRFGAEANVSRIKLHSLNERFKTLTSQIASAEIEIENLILRESLLTEEEHQQRILRERALVRDSDVNQVSLQLLETSGQIARRRSELSTLLQDQLDVELDAKRVSLEFEILLLERYRKNDELLLNLKSEEVRLSSILDTMEINSPVDGFIQSLKFDAERAYAERGKTLVTIARRLEAPRIRLQVPVTTIDQIQLGAAGKLTITSLPQRTIASLKVKLVSISPLSTKSEDGTSQGFVAEAEFEEAELLRLLKSMEGHRLSADMPVSVSLEGREMTLVEYLIPSIQSFTSQAYQD